MTARTDTAFYGDIAAEFLQHYRTGPRFLGVTGVAASDPARAADALAEALRAAGERVRRVTVAPGTEPDSFRAAVAAPFREEGPGVLVADGPGLLDSAFSGFWNFSVWLEHDPERDPEWSFVATGRKDPLGAPREVASALVDDADPERPRRLFADSC